MDMEKPRTLHLHLVSDSTGETIGAVARAALVQFSDLKIIDHSWNLTRSERQIDQILESVRLWPGFVMQTLVDQKLCRRLLDGCRALGVPCVPVLDPVMNALGAYLGQTPQSLPGRQHALDAEYFARIEAMDFAMANDDGNGLQRLVEADIVLVGVSRTSKTPTSIYLANRAVKVANVPLVPGQEPPAALLALVTKPTQPLIVGLTKEPQSLVEIRLNRLKGKGQAAAKNYTDLEDVRAEVLAARRLFAQHNWPVIDVTRRSIEETAAEIMILLANRKAPR